MKRNQKKRDNKKRHKKSNETNEKNEAKEQTNNVMTNASRLIHTFKTQMAMSLTQFSRTLNECMMKYIHTTHRIATTSTHSHSD